METLARYMAELETKAPILTLQCISYRAAKWKYNIKIPQYILEPSAYPSDFIAKPIAQIYDEVTEKGFNEPRFFVKHGLWKDMDRFYYLFRNNGLMHRERCFVCYLKFHKYPYIERDPPHDYKVDKLCRFIFAQPAGRHFIHHFNGYDDNTDHALFAKSIPKFTRFDQYTFSKKNVSKENVKFYIPP